MIKTYYALTKPGIIFGNMVTAIAGFFLASRGHIEYGLLFAMLLGLSLIIASACVFNNYIDRSIDEKMARTRNRPLVRGEVSGQEAIVFAMILGFIGTLILIMYTNLLTVSIALTGFFVYVVLYSILKPRSIYGTLVGSIAGAVPPVVGYCSVTHCLDMGAFLLFLVLILWQMPHFFAIALYRCDEYAAALIPVLPVEKGVHITKIQMLLYIIAFIIAAGLLTLCGYTGYAYLAVATLVGFRWLWLCIKGFKSTNDAVWGRQMFLFSLVVIMALCTVVSVDWR